jgi:hypothetical protein
MVERKLEFLSYKVRVRNIKKAGVFCREKARVHDREKAGVVWEIESCGDMCERVLGVC